MMKITFSNNCESSVLKLEGRLAGPWVEELGKTWHSVAPAPTGSHLVLDLCEVTYVDSEGRELLEEMHKAGVDLIGDGIMTNYLIEGIKHGHNGHRTKDPQGNGNGGGDTKSSTA
jgi:hypothetical protein